jgi:hypothetical protein
VFIIPSQNARGSIRLETTMSTKLSETGLEGTFDVWLGSQPSADVTVSFNATRPTEGRVTPAQVTFTPQNWNQRQTLTVKGLNDCLVDGLATYRVLPAMALSTDPDYAGVRGKNALGGDLQYTNADDDIAAGSGALQTCALKLVSSKRISLTVFEYEFQVDLTNLGPAVSGATAVVTSTTPNTVIVNGNVTFGPAGEQATVTSQDTFSFRQDRRFVLDTTKLRWVISPR